MPPKVFETKQAAPPAAKKLVVLLKSVRKSLPNIPCDPATIKVRWLSPLSTSPVKG